MATWEMTTTRPSVSTPGCKVAQQPGPQVHLQRHSRPLGPRHAACQGAAEFVGTSFPTEHGGGGYDMANSQTIYGSRTLTPPLQRPEQTARTWSMTTSFPHLALAFEPGPTIKTQICPLTNHKGCLLLISPLPASPRPRPPTPLSALPSLCQTQWQWPAPRPASSE